MPEIKNTFLKSKMNKDLDSRIIPNGEYRDGQNISISTSEGADVGALENIRGNIKLTNFGLKDINLKVIGYYEDTANDRVFLFITNFVDGSRSQTNNSVDESGVNTSLGRTFTRTAPANYIVCCSINEAGDVNDTILVSGAFLNFSRNFPITGVNLIENLLFFTDNRNQPRKINVETALANPFIFGTSKGYYYNEDHISVAKYAPYTPVDFLKNTRGVLESTLKNEIDEFLPPIVSAPCEVGSSNFPQYESGTTDVLAFSFNSTGTFNEGYTDISKFLSNGVNAGPGTGNPLLGGKIKVTLADNKNGSSAFVRRIQAPQPSASTPKGARVWLEDKEGSLIRSFKEQLGWNSIDGNEQTGVGGSLTVMFSTENLDYNENFEGDKDLLKDKFVRFSYRFKYDDDEYSLTAPFSQHAFIPKQFGYFIGDDTNKTKESGIVDFMENQVTTAGLVIDLPCSPDKLLDEYKIKQLQLLYKASDEQSLKVIADIDTSSPNNIKGVPKSITIRSGGGGYTAGVKETTGGSGSGLTVEVLTLGVGNTITSIIIKNPGDGYKKNDTIEVSGSANAAIIKVSELENLYIYDYNSQRPIKVLPEKELVRVSDIVPLKAKTQEAVGNRIIYGNFLQNRSTPTNIKYNVIAAEKGTQTYSNTNLEFYNHTLKQGRSYQAGIVLQDRYGRSSNVILNDANDVNFSSSFTAPYTNGGVSPTAWPGNSLNILFSNKIPTQRTDTYNGIWNSNDNPTGWYTYKIVVKQQEQDYYNVYVPGALSGNVVFGKAGDSGSIWQKDLQYENENSVFNIVLTGDNINKVPRELNKVGPLDTDFGSEVLLRTRVRQDNSFTELFDGGTGNPLTGSRNYADLSSQNFKVEDQEVSTIRPFRDLGDWTIYKGVNLKYATIGPSAVSDHNEYTDPTYIYPGLKGDIDPVFIKTTKNPIIATVNSNVRTGSSSEDQEKHYYFAKELNVFETNPVKSMLDIYYETSTAGKIEDLNNDIESSAGLPSEVISDISPINTNFREGFTIGVGETISNAFQILNANGTVFPDSSCNISIDTIEVNNGVGFGASTSVITNQNDFPIGITEQTQAVAPSTQASFVLFRKKEIVYVVNGFNDEFKIVLRASCNGQQDFTKEITVNLSNNAPEISRVGLNNGADASGTTSGERNFLYDHVKNINNYGLNQDKLKYKWPGNRVAPFHDTFSSSDPTALAAGAWIYDINNSLEFTSSQSLSQGINKLASIAYSTNGSLSFSFPTSAPDDAGVRATGATRDRLSGIFASHGFSINSIRVSTARRTQRSNSEFICGNFTQRKAVYNGETLNFGVQDPRSSPRYYDLMPNQNLLNPISLKTEFNNQMDFNIKFEDFGFELKTITGGLVYVFLTLNVSEELLNDFEELATKNHIFDSNGAAVLPKPCGLVFQFSIKVKDAFNSGLDSDNYEFNVFLSHEEITS